VGFIRQRAQELVDKLEQARKVQVHEQEQARKVLSRLAEQSGPFTSYKAADFCGDTPAKPRNDLFTNLQKPMDIIPFEQCSLAKEIVRRVLPDRKDCKFEKLEAILVVGATGSGKTAGCISAGEEIMKQTMNEQEKTYVVLLNALRLDLKEALAKDPTLQALSAALKADLSLQATKQLQDATDMAVRRMLAPHIAWRLHLVKQDSAFDAMTKAFQYSEVDVKPASCSGIPLKDCERLVVIFDEAQDIMGGREIEFPSRGKDKTPTGILSLLIHGTCSFERTSVVVNGTNSSVVEIKQAMQGSGVRGDEILRDVLAPLPLSVDDVKNYLKQKHIDPIDLKDCVSLAGRPRLAALYAAARGQNMCANAAVNDAVKQIANVILARWEAWMERDHVSVDRAVLTLAKCISGLTPDTYEWPVAGEADFALVAFGYYKNGACSEVVLHAEHAIVEYLLSGKGVESLKQPLSNSAINLNNQMTRALRSVSPEGAGVLFERSMFYRIYSCRGGLFSDLLVSLGCSADKCQGVRIPAQLEIRRCPTAAGTCEAMFGVMKAKCCNGVLLLPTQHLGPDIILHFRERGNSLYDHYVLFLALKFQDRPSHDMNVAQARCNGLFDNDQVGGGAVGSLKQEVRLLVKDTRTTAYAAACCYALGREECAKDIDSASDGASNVYVGHCSNEEVNKFLNHDMKRVNTPYFEEMPPKMPTTFEDLRKVEDEWITSGEQPAKGPKLDP